MKLTFSVLDNTVLPGTGLGAEVFGMRIFIFLVFVLISFSARGQSLQDTAYWEEYDNGMVDRIWEGLEEQTYRRLFDSLKVEMSARLANGPVTTSLAYRYHWISLNLKNYFLSEVRPYADTAIMLRVLADAPTADIAQSHYEKGRVLRELGNEQEALFYFEEGVRIMSKAIEELDSIPDLAKRQAYFLKEAAWTAGMNGNVELARLRLKQIPPLLRIDTSAGGDRTLYEAIMTKAYIEGVAGDLESSVESYTEAINVDFFQSLSLESQGVGRSNLGLKLVLTGRYEAAEEELNRAISIFKSAGKWVELSYAYINLMNLYVQQNQPTAALEVFELAESSALQVVGKTKGVVFGELYLFAALAKEALGLKNEANVFWAKAASALLANAQLYGPAQLPYLEGNTIFAQPTLLEVLTAKRDLFKRAYAEVGAVDDLLRAHATSFSIDTLLRLNREQLNLTSSLGIFLNKEAKQYSEAVSIALALFRRTNDDRYLQEAYQFVAGQKSNLLRRYLTSPELASTLGVPTEVVEEKKTLDLQVLIVEKALQNASGPEESLLRDSLLELNYRATRLKEALAENYPSFRKALRGFTAIDPAFASANLDDNQLLVEFFLATDSIYSFTLSKADGLTVNTVARPTNLTELIGSVVDQGVGATVLYELLVAPIIAGRPGITRLQFIPDGDLWKIPFAALKKGEDFLIRDYAVSFAYAAPLLFDADLAARAQAREEEYLGYGISYDDLQQNLSGAGLRSADLRDLRQMGRLPFASQEVQKAAQVIGGAYRLNEQASLAKFLEESAGANILHLSMHGLLRPNPMESALVFSGDGEEEYALLEMKDVLGGHYPAELTVLSACHTGGGTLMTSEGMQSIGRAFTAAGSRATITSTWAARDESTHDILGYFFAELKAGAPKDIALQRAINVYLAEGTAADRNPDHWANLTLTGVVSPIEQRTSGLLLGVVLLALALGGAYLLWAKG